MKSQKRKYPGLCDKCLAHPCKCSPVKKQQQTGWAIFEPKGVMRIHTIRVLKRDSINAHLNFYLPSPKYSGWKEWESNGWTCRKVVIQEK